MKIKASTLPALLAEKTPKKHQDILCLCRTLSPVLTICRLVGIFPIKWVHESGQCTYKKSYPWLMYSAVLNVVHVIQLIQSSNVFRFYQNQPLPILLSEITEIIYNSLIAILTFTNIIRFPRFARTFSRIAALCKKGILCHSALQALQKIQYGLVVALVLSLVAQHGLLIGLTYSDDYDINFDINIFVTRGIWYVVFVFYMLFSSIFALFVSMYGCFEKMLISSTKYEHVHPMKSMSETNNVQEFLGFIRYKVCKDEHCDVNELPRFTRPELIDYLRCLHEDISSVLYDSNSCLNPQFLIHMIVELTVLILHFYSVIIYIVYDFDTTYTSAVNVLNWEFAIFHSLGLFVYLQNAQQLKNMVLGLINLLLEYSTRISSPEEHQQIRIFVEKVKQHRPVTASGIFTIDLGIAGPICANVLTHVLVALQFEVPTN